MNSTLKVALFFWVVPWILTVPSRGEPLEVTATERAGCNALRLVLNLTIIYADVAVGSDGAPYCYVKGILPPAIQFHIQLPLPRNWNGRFLKWGDGGKDGDLDLADHRVADGYAVANSNTGHDSGAEPASSFALDNRQAEIDFGYRAVHLTTVAGKTLVESYYGRPPEYSYFEGCSTGGRQGLMEAQRYPDDFDGIVAGAPANHYQEMNAVRVWLLQRMFRDDFEGSLAFDTDGDSRFDSVRKLELLAEEVIKTCDRDDGVRDGVIDDPSSCDFDPLRDLTAFRCPGDVDGEGCFTAAQLRTVDKTWDGITQQNAFGSKSFLKQRTNQTHFRPLTSRKRYDASREKCISKRRGGWSLIAALNSRSPTSEVPNSRHKTKCRPSTTEFLITEFFLNRKIEMPPQRTETVDSLGF